MREMTASSQRQLIAASNPMGTPMMTAPATDTTPAMSDARAPQSTRESTSRPFSSVPNQ